MCMILPYKRTNLVFTIEPSLITIPLMDEPNLSAGISHDGPEWPKPIETSFFPIIPLFSSEKRVGKGWGGRPHHVRAKKWEGGG